MQVVDLHDQTQGAKMGKGLDAGLEPQQPRRRGMGSSSVAICISWSNTAPGDSDLSQRPKWVNMLWPPQCFTVLITGRIFLMNFHCQHLVSVVVVLSTMNTKNTLFLSIAMADEILENLLSALDWAVFPCRPCIPTTSIFASWSSGTLHCASSAALQLHINPAEALLMISRGGFFYVSLPTYQCVFTAQNPWLTSSFLFTLIPIPFWDNWADSYSPPCLHSCFLPA